MDRSRYELITTSKLHEIRKLAAALEPNKLIVSNSVRSICHQLQHKSGVRFAYIATLTDFVEYFDCNSILYSGNLIDIGIPPIQAAWMVSKSNGYRLLNRMDSLIDWTPVIQMRKFENVKKQRQMFQNGLQNTNTGDFLTFGDLFPVFVVWYIGCMVGCVAILLEIAISSKM